MNIRQLYIAFIFVFALALFYQYSSEQRVISADREVELMKVEAAKQLDLNGGDFVYLENDLLRLVIKTSDGLKEYQVMSSSSRTTNSNPFGSTNPYNTFRRSHLSHQNTDIYT